MNYQRIKIDGIITTQGEMTVASGQLTKKKPETRDKEGNDITPKYTEICLDKDNNPYIPGSSLRGLLASLSNNIAQQSEDIPTRSDCYRACHSALFGDPQNKKPGKLRIYDATWNSSTPYQKGSHIHSHNAIDPITATAKDQHLFNDAFVAEHSKFEWPIEADDISEHQTQYLYSLLLALKESPLVQIGKGQSKQKGLFNWQSKTPEKPIKVLNKEKLIQWLKQPEPTELSYISINPKALTIKFNTQKLIAYPLEITTLSPLLINDPTRVSGKETEPKFEYYRNQSGDLIIPSSSLIGVIKQHCRKILLTLCIAQAQKSPQDNHEQENQRVDALLDTMFGATKQKSKIWLEDAIADDTQEHRQTFNAVDRFTGGVAEGALYSVCASTSTKIKTTLFIDQRQIPLNDWQKGLLVLLLRDAMEADLCVGWGKAKGYGNIKLSQITLDKTQLDDWDGIKQYYSFDKRKQWINRLNEKCKPEIKGD